MEFLFKVRTPEGILREGRLEAVSMEAAIEGLQRRNLIVVNVLPVREGNKWQKIFSTSIERISSKDVVLLSRQLATLFEARVPIVESLRTMAGEVSKNSIQKIINQVLEDIQGGLSLSEAMSKHPKLFSDLYVNMVRSGEESGKLSDVFNYLADYLERSYELKGKAKNAMLYPAFIILAFIIVMFLVLTIIIPNLSTIFTDAGVELPIYTRVVIGVGNFVRDFWILVFTALALAGAILWRYIQTPIGRKTWERFTMSLPIVGNLQRKIFMARLCDNLQTLLSAGVPVIRSLEISSQVVGSVVYHDILREAIESVKGGDTISEAFYRHAEIPLLVTQMMKIGEEAGKLNTMLQSLSRFYRREVDSLIENFVSLIEPVLILVLGAGVAFLVASVLLPLYSISAAF